MTANEIMVNRIYRAKQPRRTRHSLVNDRFVLWAHGDRVQYDGPAVGFGQHYPTVSMAAFLAWAGEDVTDSLPAGYWLTWKDYIKTRREARGREKAQ